MRKLGEQWIEEINGKRHVLMVAEAINKGHVCNGCAFNNGTCDYKGDECPVPKGCYIKDLGILNDDGCLPCPFCGEYPNITIKGGWFMGTLRTIYGIVCKDHAQTRFVANMQEAIDAWNRRA